MPRRRRTRLRDVHPVIDAVPRLDTGRGARTPGEPAPVAIAAAFTIVVAALLLVPFLASRRTDTALRTDVAEWRPAVTLIAGAIGTACSGSPLRRLSPRAISVCGGRDPGLGRARSWSLARVCWPTERTRVLAAASFSEGPPADHRDGVAYGRTDERSDDHITGIVHSRVYRASTQRRPPGPVTEVREGATRWRRR